MGTIYCDSEGRAFDEAEFADGPDGLTIHVLRPTAGHTTEGWRATYVATARDGGGWNVEEVTVQEPAIDTPDAEAFDDRA